MLSNLELSKHQSCRGIVLLSSLISICFLSRLRTLFVQSLYSLMLALFPLLENVSEPFTLSLN